MSEEKIEVISRLVFSDTLKDLKRYLSLIRWLKNYVSYYIQLMTSLQQRKISLICTHQNKFNQTISELITSAEFKSFHVLQTMFSEPQFLIHFNLKQCLYIDLNASKQHDFEVMIYHFKSETTDILSYTDIESILFLSKLLSKAENNYWLMKLKMTDLV